MEGIMALYKHPYKGKYKEYISSWGDDRTCEEYEEKIDNWLVQFPVSDQDFMLDLVKRFRMFQGHYYTLQIKKLFLKFCETYLNWNTDANSTLFFPIKKDHNEVNNSDVFFLDFWRCNNIREYCKNNLQSLEVLPNFVVFVDDFSGTGRTFLTALSNEIESRHELKNTKIIVLFMAVTSIALAAINQFAIEEEISLDVVFANKYEKAFSPNYCKTFLEAEQEKNRYLIACQRFQLKYLLGFDDTQALIGFGYNTPNNTLGVFWEKFNGKQLNFIPLLNRDDHRHLTLADIKNGRRQRIVSKKANKAPYDVKREIDLLFASLCVASKKKFNRQKIIHILGITHAQFETRLSYCLEFDYLKLSDGAFLPTEKLLNIIDRKGNKKFLREILEGKSSETTEKYIESFRKVPIFIPHNFKND